MSDDYHIEVDILLDCNHIILEAIEAAVFSPLPGETRGCPKCKRTRVIKKVGAPYRVDHASKDQTTNK